MGWARFPVMTLLALAVSSGAASAADMPTFSMPTGPQPATASLSDPSFFLHVGPIGIFTSESAKISVGGTLVPGATIAVDPQATAGFEIGYYFTRSWAIAYSGGFPPKAAIDGDGTAAAFGTLGSVIYGPSALLIQYHFKDWGMFQPYVGVGPVYMLIFDNNDNSIANLKVDNAVGAAVQVGADIMFNQNWGVYVDVKKTYLRTKARGNVFSPVGPPMTADVTLDPLFVGAGLTYRF